MKVNINSIDRVKWRELNIKYRQSWQRLEPYIKDNVLPPKLTQDMHDDALDDMREFLDKNNCFMPAKGKFKC